MWLVADADSGGRGMNFRSTVGDLLSDADTDPVGSLTLRSAVLRRYIVKALCVGSEDECDGNVCCPGFKVWAFPCPDTDDDFDECL